MSGGVTGAEDRRVLVTGAGGFIGRHAVAALRARGFAPVTLGRRPVEGAEGWIEADLLDPKAAAAAARAAAAPRLLHLAWNAEPGRFWTAPDNLDWVAATLTLLRGFVDGGGRRAVMAGTCAEYAWGADGPLDELSASCAPATLYGVAKDATRRLVLDYAARSGVSAAWGRVFFLYGPGEKPGRLVSDAIAALRAGRPFATTAGAQRRDFIHVADVGDAFAALVASDMVGPVNIGSGAATPLRDLLGEIARRIGAEGLLRLGALPDRPGDPACIEAAVTRLRATGFSPRFNLADGVADAVASQDHKGLSGSAPI